MVWRIFFQIIEYGRQLSNSLLGSTRSLSIYGASYKIISLRPERLLKTQIFEKTAKFQEKETFWRKFSCKREDDKLHGTIN